MVKLLLNQDASENIIYNNKYLKTYIKKGALSEYSGYRAMCHWHADLEFMYIYEGKMNYNVNGDIVSLHAGQGLFVNSTSLHYGFSDEKTECKYLCVILHPDVFSSNLGFVENFVSPILSNTSIPYIVLKSSSEWQNDILLTLMKIGSLKDAQNESFLLLHYFLNILELIVNNYDSVHKIEYNDRNLSDLAAMLGYIQANYGNKISVKELAEAGNCCKTKCSELFKKYLQTSPNQYVNNFRLEKSTQKLVASDLTITEVAYICGFTSSSYYCEAFHKMFGTTPKEYRIRQRQNVHS